MERTPDFNRLRDTLLRRTQHPTVPLFELAVHTDLMNAVRERFQGLKPLTDVQWAAPATRFPALVDFWRGAGYDYVRPYLNLGFELQAIAEDDEGDRGGRDWMGEHGGVITDRETFDAYPWPKADLLDHSEVTQLSAGCPDDMGLLLAIGGGFLEWGMRLMGFEGYCMALYQDLELIQDLQTRIGEHLLATVERAFQEAPRIDAVIIGDDMGFRTSTMIAPETLRDLILPWHTRLVDLVHSHDIPFILHCCGHLLPIMDDLIDKVRIDAKHSYEDQITPVWEAKKLWGDKIAILGGVDMDIMSRASEQDCRARVRDVLAKCTPGGGYALGTGNTVADYVKRENYLALLEEGWNWRN
jgi:uroporphyrinogen decarboxylase